MSSQNWRDWSLEDLKDLVEQTRPTLLKDSTAHFDQTVSHLGAVQDTFMAHMKSLGAAWQGKAATAAINNAQTTYESMDSTRSLSASASQQTTSYQTQLASHQQQAAAVPNVDTSWGHAASSGGWAGAIGIGVAKYEQQKKYDENRDQMAEIVEKMDAGGNEQAAAMKGNSWPSGSTMTSSPPSSLPPVPGSSTPKGPSVPTNPRGGNGGSGNSPGGPGYTPVGTGTSSNPDDGSVLHGPKGHHGPAGTSTTSPSGTQVPGDPTLPQGAGGGPGDPGQVPGGTPVVSPPGPGAPGAGGAAAAVLGGTGLLGAGAAGGRTLLGGAAGAAGAGGRGGAAGDPEGRLSARDGAGRGAGRGAGSGEGESGLRGGSSGAGAGADEGGLRAGGSGRGATGIPADDELGAGRGNALRAGSGGFGGEPVAAEAGRTGGYPMGGGGGRRRSEDEEAPVPEYLVETDDVWGDGASAAPPVIGE